MCPRSPTTRPSPGSILAGDVVVEGPTEPAPTVLLMSTEDNPQPPLGAGFPFNFAATGATSFGGTDGLISAPFLFTNVEPGGYYLFGVFDVDRNFHPQVTALQTPTCGDWVGWHASDLDGTPAPARVGENERSDGNTVVIRDEVPGSPPVAAIVGSNALDPDTPLRLESLGLQGAFGTVSEETGERMRVDIPEPDPNDPCAAAFRFERVDADGDGTADGNTLLPISLPGPNFEDRYPRVLFLYLGEEIDDDGDDITDRYDPGDEAGNVVAALGGPSPADDPLPEPGVEIRTTALSVDFTGVGLRVPPEGEIELILDSGDLPSGAWSVLLITQEGQLWQLPNELDPTSGRRQGAAPARPRRGRRADPGRRRHPALNVSSRSSAWGSRGGPRRWRRGPGPGRRRGPPGPPARRRPDRDARPPEAGRGPRSPRRGRCGSRRCRRPAPARYAIG